MGLMNKKDKISMGMFFRYYNELNQWEQKIVDNLVKSN
jgi:hypothetical protein